jgi:hypothetical protein
MRVARILWVCGAAVVGVAAVGRPASGQVRSATLHVSAQVIDVGALAPLPFDPMEATTSSAAAVAAPSSRAFSVVPPQGSDVAVTMQVRGMSVGARRAMAIQVCRRSEEVGAPCRRLPFVDSSDGIEAAAVTDHAVHLRLLGLTGAATDSVRVTITLAYPGS